MITHIQTNRSYLNTIDNYCPIEYADNLYLQCKGLCLIVEPRMKLGTAHRCMNFYSNVSTGYKFSGQIMKAEPLPNFLLDFMTAVNNSLNTQFNGILINYYRGGSDCLGSHADAEEDLFNGMVVGYTMMSHNGKRKFRIRDMHSQPIFDNSLYKDIITKHNQLLIMGGDFQKEFKHEIPIEKTNQLAERLSITLRYHKK